MRIDYNELTLEEQLLIIYTSNLIKSEELKARTTMWTKFLKKGFEAVCKTIAKKKF